MTPDEYLDRLRVALADLPDRDRNRAVTTLRDEFEQAQVIGGEEAVRRLMADLGEPINVARDFGEALTEEEPNARGDRRAPGGSGGTDLWQAGGQPVFPAKPFGLGQSLNLGALAARIGVIRPDDDDERAWAATGTAGDATLICLSASAVLTQLAILAFAWRKLPSSLPTHWGITGTADHYVDTSSAITTTLGLALAATLAATAVVFHHRRHRHRAVQTTVWCALLAWATTITLNSAILAPTAGLVTGLLGMVVVIALLAVVPALALRRGVRRVAEPREPETARTARKE